MLTLEDLTGSRESKKNTGSNRSGAPRGQSYKFMRHITGLKKNGLSSTFNFANEFWKKFDLDNNGFFQVTPKNDDGTVKGVYLVLVSDSEESKDYKPTILNRTGKGTNKTNGFSSNVLEEPLVKLGVLKPQSELEVVKNQPAKQYIKLTQVDAPETPEIKAVFELSVDEREYLSGDESDDESDDEAEDDNSDNNTESENYSESEEQEEEDSSDDKDVLGGL